jgi:WD40 repeat protein
MAIFQNMLVSVCGTKLRQWDLRAIAASNLSDVQRGELGRYRSLSSNSTGVSGHMVIGHNLYAVSVDNAIRQWDLRSARCRLSLRAHNDFVRCVTCVGNVLITGSDDKTVKLWDLEFHDVLTTLEGHTSFVTSVCAFKGRLFTGAMDSTVRVWE